MISTDREREMPLVDRDEEDTVTRKILVWLNTCPDLPVSIVAYEAIQPDCQSLSLSVSQGTRIIEQDIIGGYTAEFQALLISRVQSGESMDARLQADETLEKIARWAKRSWPDLGSPIQVRDVEVRDRAAVAAQFESGDEDHTITLAVQYYVPPVL